MNYYFFPKIDNLDSSVTLVNFSCLENQINAVKDAQSAYACWSDGKLWHYQKLGQIGYKEAIEIKHSELPVNLPSSPFLFFCSDDLPKTSQMLFVSDHMHVMPTWRGNIKIFSQYSASSYEGDYQYEMVTRIKKGSLVSISPMFQNKANTKNYFILVNITPSPTLNEHTIHFFDPVSEKILYSSNVYNNRCNVVDLSHVNMPNNTPIMVISKTIAGIPIYFSCSNDYKLLSFEHTHPPASLVVFGDPLHFQRKLKDSWLKKLEEVENA